MGWLLLTETIWHDAALVSHTSDNDTVKLIGTSVWFGGHKLFGFAVRLPMIGGVVSTTLTVLEHIAELSELSTVRN